MTSVVTSPQSIARTHVKVERSRVTSPARENFRPTTVVSPTPKSPTLSPQKPSLPTNKRFSNVQSKVGSLDSISYKPKASEKKILSIKQDFSHIKSKVDAKLVLPPQESEDNVEGEAATATATAGTNTTRTSRTAPAKKPTVNTTGSKINNASGNTKVLSPTSRTSSVSSIRTATAQSSRTTSVASGAPNSSTQPSHTRRESVSSTTSSVTSPKSPTRRISKHIIPTQKAEYGHIKSKVGSFDNIAHVPGGRTSSQGSSDEGNGARSPSPSALSSTSSSGPTSPRRSGFKIPKSKKVDYSNVRSKVGSLDNATHVPQGGNLRIFSEKLNFREQAQSKIQKEINIVQFYDYSVENSIQEEQEDLEGEQQDQSIIYSSDGDADEFEPPKNILSVLDEMTKSVEELELEGHQQQEQQANDDSRQEIDAAL